MTKYYFAARYSLNAKMREYRDLLTKEIPSAIVTSRWIDQHGGTQLNAMVSSELMINPNKGWIYAQKDLQDIDEADVLVSFTNDTVGSKGGRHIEFGYALALGIKLVIIGVRENVFHANPNIELYNSFEEFLKHERNA